MAYHQFVTLDGEPYGSFEVFEAKAGEIHPDDEREPGFYWAAGFPGCLFDGEPEGPFATYDEAREAAIA